jgi:hypothetical protein
MCRGGSVARRHRVARVQSARPDLHVERHQRRDVEYRPDELDRRRWHAVGLDEWPDGRRNIHGHERLSGGQWWCVRESGSLQRHVGHVRNHRRRDQSCWHDTHDLGDHKPHAHDRQHARGFGRAFEDRLGYSGAFGFEHLHRHDQRKLGDPKCHQPKCLRNGSGVGIGQSSSRRRHICQQLYDHCASPRHLQWLTRIEYWARCDSGNRECYGIYRKAFRQHEHRTGLCKYRVVRPEF